MLGFQTLRCPSCDKSDVIQVGSLVWQEGKGQAFSPKGYFCLECLTPFNTEKSIANIRAGELREKIKELEASTGR